MQKREPTRRREAKCLQVRCAESGKIMSEVFPRGDYELPDVCLCGEYRVEHDGGVGRCSKTGCYLFRADGNRRVVEAFDADCESKMYLNLIQPLRLYIV